MSGVGDNTPIDPAERAGEIRDELRRRLSGMSDELRKELFDQMRLVGEDYEEVSPHLLVDAAEGTTIFRGLNNERHLMGGIDEALGTMAADPGAAARYEEKLNARRGKAGGAASAPSP